VALEVARRVRRAWLAGEDEVDWREAYPEGARCEVEARPKGEPARWVGGVSRARLGVGAALWAEGFLLVELDEHPDNVERTWWSRERVRPVRDEEDEADWLVIDEMVRRPARRCAYCAAALDAEGRCSRRVVDVALATGLRVDEVLCDEREDELWRAVYAASVERPAWAPGGGPPGASPDQDADDAVRVYRVKRESDEARAARHAALREKTIGAKKP